MDNPARPAKARPEEKKKTIYVRFGDFLRKYRIVVFALFGAAALALIGVAVGTAIKDSVVKASTARLEKLDADFAAYSSEQDAAKKADLEKAFLASADDVAKKARVSTPAKRRCSTRRRSKNPKRIGRRRRRTWLAIATAAPESYLAPVALQGAAAAAEELGSADRAPADYQETDRQILGDGHRHPPRVLLAGAALRGSEGLRGGHGLVPKNRLDLARRRLDKARDRSYNLS